jgi:hypothetical protein
MGSYVVFKPAASATRMAKTISFDCNVLGFGHNHRSYLEENIGGSLK